MGNMKLVKCLFFVVAVTFLSTGILIARASAQEPTEEPTELALFEEIPIVYTPAKKEQLITEAPASTYILTYEDIKLYGGINIYDPLRLVSGVNVAANTVSQPDINIRGLVEHPANSTLLLIDGRNIYQPAHGFFVWETLPIQLDEIKQIEVVKGPVASLYGANAFSGLINVITKSPEEINGTIISGKLGTEDTYIGSLVHGQKINNLGYKLSLGWRYFDFFDNDDNTDIGKLNTELQFDLSDISKLSISAGGVNGRFPFGGGGEAGGEADTLFTYTKLKYELERFSISGFWNYNDFDHDTPMHHHMGRTDACETELKYNFDLWERHSITVGGGGRYERAEMDDLPDGEEDQVLWNIYLQDDFEITEALRLVGSGRLDYHPLLDYIPTGRLAGIYNLTEDHLIRASVGNSFRAPSITEFYEDYISTVDTDAFLHTLGNKDLDDETIITPEIGYQGWLFDRKLTVYIDVFWSELKDMIDFVAEPPEGLPGPPEPGIVGPPPIGIPLQIEGQYENLGKIITWGVEPGAEIKFTDWLKGMVNYSYQEADFKDDAFIRITPKHKVNIGVIATIKEKLTASVYGHYVSESEYDVGSGTEKIDEYFLLNARVGYQFTNNIELALAGSNLLNDKHQEIPDGEEIGRRIVGEVNIRF